jgi:hypothetical protein
VAAATSRAAEQRRLVRKRAERDENERRRATLLRPALSLKNWVLG